MAIQCDFVYGAVAGGQRSATCPVCGYRTTIPSLRLGRTCGVKEKPCKERPGPCQHQGSEVRQVDVKLCKGRSSTRAVCGCTIYGECVVLWPTVKGVKCCERCRDYVQEG